MREHFRDNFEGNEFFFCKTAQKPYDVVVVACLAVLKHRMKDLIVISSDGDSADWWLGVAMARRILKADIKNPIRDLDNKSAS